MLPTRILIRLVFALAYSSMVGIAALASGVSTGTSTLAAAESAVKPVSNVAVAEAASSSVDGRHAFAIGAGCQASAVLDQMARVLDVGTLQ